MNAWYLVRTHVAELTADAETQKTKQKMRRQRQHSACSTGAVFFMYFPSDSCMAAKSPCCSCSVDLCLVVCDHRARLSRKHRHGHQLGWV